MQEISGHVYFVQGARNGAIYNLNTSQVFSVNDIACGIIRRAAVGGPLTEQEQGYVRQLEDQGLFISGFLPGAEDMSEVPEGLAFDVVWLEITQACNMRCVHCYEGCSHVPAREGQRLTMAEWQRVIDEVAALGTKRVVVIGGEPTLDDRVEDLLVYLSEKGLQTTLFTNGSFRSERLIRIICQYQINVKFSLYGHCAEVHDAVTHYPGSFEQLMTHVRYFLSQGVTVTAAVILMKENEDCVSQIKEFLSSVGITRYKFDVIREVLSGAQSAHKPEREEVIRLGRITRPHFVLSRERFRLFFDKNTCWNRKLVVTETGHLLPCVFARTEQMGDVRTQSLQQVLASPELQRYWGFTFDQVELCGQCEFKLACKDCRPLALAVRGVMTDKNPRCCYNPQTGVWKND